MKNYLMWDKYDNCYRQVIDVKELREYIQTKIKELEQKRKEVDGIYTYIREIRLLQSFLKDLEVEDD